MTEKAREIVARALLLESGVPWDDGAFAGREIWWQTADSILTALREAGLAIVPVEATDSALIAGARAIAAYGTSHFGDARPLEEQDVRTQAMRLGEARDAWRAMLTASQSPAPDQGKRDGDQA